MVKGIKQFKSHAWVYLSLNAGALVISLLIYFLMDDGAFSPYVKAMAINILSLQDFLSYLIGLALYGFVLEFLFRVIIQDKILKKGNCWKFRTVAFLVPVFISLAIHWQFGIIGLIYGGTLSAFASLFYLYKTKWLGFSLWHATWGFVIIPLCMAFCVFQEGQIRDDFLFVYKKRHILKEKMTFRENWGWVDKVHYRPEHFEHFYEAVHSGKKETSMSDGWVTPIKIRVTFTCNYEIQKGDNALEDWAIVTGMMLDFMRANEVVQQDSPWYHGNQLSAWQFDDMSSALLCSLDRLPDEYRVEFGKTVTDQNELLDIWEEQGEAMIKLKVKETESWQMLQSPKAKELFELVKKMQSNWRRTAFERI